MTGGTRRHTVWQWLLVPAEGLFSWLAGSRPVPKSRGTFLVAPRRHSGGPVPLPDGTVIRRGDQLVEIHFWNRRIATRAGGDPAAVTWRFIRDFRADLGALARAIGSGQVAVGARAVFGASPMAPGAARFGFLVRPMPAGWRRGVLGAWQRMIRRVFRPRAVRSETSAETAEMWMSTPELLRRYGRAGEAAPAADPGRRGGAAPAADPGPRRWGGTSR